MEIALVLEDSGEHELSGAESPRVGQEDKHGQNDGDVVPAEGQNEPMGQTTCLLADDPAGQKWPDSHAPAGATSPLALQ